VRLPVSVKGVVLDEEKVILLENERGEWELPGGRLEAGESLRECVERELCEEINLRVEAGPLLDAYVYEVVEGKEVSSWFMGVSPRASTVCHSEEHSGVGHFALAELGGINLPEGYGRAIRAWVVHLRRKRDTRSVSRYNLGATLQSVVALGRSQAARRRVLVPGSQVRILPPQRMVRCQPTPRRTPEKCPKITDESLRSSPWFSRRAKAPG
jgi:ADP-ribose pyrophosphatase YjhB (NUDIX family)